MIFPWGIACAIKWCIKHYNEKKLETRKVDKEPQSIETKQPQQHAEASFTVDQTEEKYQQYSQNPQDTNAKQAMIDIFKYGDQCMVFQFLVKQMPIKDHQASFLPADLSAILHDYNNGLQTYETFTSLYRSLSTTHGDVLYGVINTIMPILNSEDGAERTEQIQSLGNLISHYQKSNSPITNSITILAFNIFTDAQIDQICGTDGFPAEFKQTAHDTKALRSFIKGLSTEQLQAIAKDNYSPKAFSKLLCTPQNNVQVSTKCAHYFQGGHGQEALQILIGQKLMMQSPKTTIIKTAQPLTSKMILQMNLSSSTIDFLTDQNLINYANSTNVRLEEPSSQLQRNKIAFTCCMLTDDQLTKIIDDENMPRKYKEIAYCIGTMRTILEQYTSEELFKALQNNQPSTCTFNGLTFHATNLESKQNTQDLYWTETIKEMFATEEEATYEYNEFWHEYHDFNRALLQQMIAIELRTNPKHQQFYEDNKSAIDSATKIGASDLITNSNQY